MDSLFDTGIEIEVEQESESKMVYLEYNLAFYGVEEVFSITFGLN